MAVRFGSLVAMKSKKEFICVKCKEQIKANSHYLLTRGRSSAGKFFSQKYHLHCWPQYMLERIQDRKENPRSNAKLKPSVISVLTEEQIKRRETLQNYLVGKDKVRLIRAYNSGEQEKVFDAYRRIAVHWAELHAQGIPFRTTLLTQKLSDKITRANLNDKDQQLNDHIGFKDMNWYSMFSREPDVAVKISMLIRPYTPDDVVRF